MHLVLFLTENLSLQKWEQLGILHRELALYRKFSEQGVKITIVSYGGPEDLQYQSEYPDFQIAYNRWKLPRWLYNRMLPRLHSKIFRTADLIKTNQMLGGNHALRAANKFKVPLVARCGYMLSWNKGRTFSFDSPLVKRYMQLEKRVFNGATAIVLTTAAMREYAIEKYNIPNDKIHIVPNFVDTELFKPIPQTEKKYDIIYVGRISQEKNVESLLKAIEPTHYRLLLIGKGFLKPQLVNHYQHLTDRVEWLDNIPNSELPNKMNQARVFVLPSIYEGHPKALLEAMACEMPVIATNTTGNNEVICPYENGLLCETTPQSIRENLDELMNDISLQHRVATGGRRFVVEHYSLHKISQLELQLYQNLLIP